MALSGVMKNYTFGQITLADGTGTPLNIVLDVDQGDLSFGPLKDKLNETVKFERRGKFKSAAPGARIYPSGSFTCMVGQFTDASAEIISDFLLRNNAFSAAVSTLGTSYPIYTVDITFVMEGTNHGDSADHTVTLHDCDCTIDSFSEGDPNTISVSFEVLGEVSGDLACDEIT